MLADFEKVLDRLDGLRLVNDKEAMALCPAHDDRNPSLSIKAEDDRLLLKCFAGCAAEEIVAAIGLEMSDLFADWCTGARANEGIPSPSPPSTGNEQGGGGDSPPPRSHAPVHQAPPGCTLEQYAEAKKLPVEFLRGLGLSDLTYQNCPAVKISYPDEAGSEVAARFRISLDGADRFRWRSGEKPCLYGLPLLEKAREAGFVLLVEGESDCHTAWLHDVPALGVPGVHTWRNDWSEHLDGIGKVYVVEEPDQGGEFLRGVLSDSPLKERLYRVTLAELGAKDLSELHLLDESAFEERLEEALEGALSCVDLARTEARERLRRAWDQCKDLAEAPDILARFAEELVRLGVAGEETNAKLLYLAVTSRLLEKPVSVAVKGPSSSGKSYLVEEVLRSFPSEAFYTLTALSERSLAYDEEPLEHRALVIYEASGMEGDMQTYLIRSLLSEGRLRYLTTQKTAEGIKPLLIEREGPTALVVTTTAVKLHPENETRLISLTVTDTQQQTADILTALAEETVEEVNLEPWQALQVWLQGAEHRVTVPFAKTLAGMVPPVAVRLRRDFGAVLNLIRAHAVLHQTSRSRDADGRIVVGFEDYGSVRDLVVDLVSAGVGATVKPEVRDTVEKVRRLLDDGEEHVTRKQLQVELKLDRSSVTRRCQAAIEDGYLKNLEERRRQPARYVLGDEMPDDLEILPTAEDLKEGVFGTEREKITSFVNAGRSAAA